MENMIILLALVLSLTSQVTAIEVPSFDSNILNSFLAVDKLLTKLNALEQIVAQQQMTIISLELEQNRLREEYVQQSDEMTSLKIDLAQAKNTPPRLAWTGQVSKQASSYLPSTVYDHFVSSINNTDLYSLKIPQNGIYLVLSQGRLQGPAEGTVNRTVEPQHQWSMRIQNLNTSEILFTALGNKQVQGSYRQHAIEGATTGFWIGQLSEGDVLQQQYVVEIKGKMNDLAFWQDGMGSTSIYAVRIA